MLTHIRKLKNHGKGLLQFLCNRGIATDFRFVDAAAPSSPVLGYLQ